MICTAANALWLAASLPEARRFRRASGHVRREQRQLLREILRANADTEFGRRHAFATIRTEHEYRARVPVHSYEDLRRAVRRRQRNWFLTRLRCSVSSSAGFSRGLPISSSAIPI
jgi:hypothetical protein